MNITLYKRCALATCPTKPNCSHPWWFKFMHEGRLHQETTRLTNSKEAMRQAHHRRTAIIQDANGVPNEDARKAGGRVNLQQLAARYCEFHLAHTPRSYDNARRAVEHFARIIGGTRDIRTINAGDVERFRAVRLSEPNRPGRPADKPGDTVSRGSIRTETISVRAMFRQAEIWYRGVKSPWQVITTSAGQQKQAVASWAVDEDEIQVATPEEVKRCLMELPAPYNLFCEITYRVLPRLSEVVTLRRDQVSITLGRDGAAVGVLQRRVKGGKQKRWQIPLRLAQRLIAQAPEGSDLLFPDYADSTAISSDFRRYFDALDLPHLHHHVFRHTGITRMLDAGVGTKTIVEMAGWSSAKQLLRYGHVNDLERDRAANVNAVEIEDTAAPTPPPAPAPAPAPAAPRARRTPRRTVTG